MEITLSGPNLFIVYCYFMTIIPPLFLHNYILVYFQNILYGILAEIF
jgi:hypothetical protein